MAEIATDALQLIGHTPLVALDRLHVGAGRIFAKAEFMQPGGSVKDRAAKCIIEDARRSGKLKPGQTVVEMTSGNMGAGLSVVCNITGNPFIAVMSAGNSEARARMLRSLGAQVVLVPQVDGEPGRVTGADIDRATEVALEISRERGAFYVDQFNAAGSLRAHESGTGPEIWTALGGALDGFVAGVGTGGTLIGTGRFLKNQNPGIVCAAVEPEGAEVLAGKSVTSARHILQGIGYGFVPPHWDSSLIDATIAVADREAEDYKLRLAVLEGLHVGFSSAANVCAAVKLIESGRLGDAPTVVTVLCDTGLKY